MKNRFTTETQRHRGNIFINFDFEFDPKGYKILP
jgi:hypothetical protein